MTKISSLKLTVGAITALSLAATATAQDDAATWTGEGSLSAGVTTGNTETTDLGLGLDLGREMGLWKVGVQAAADYGETEGNETKNRLFFGANLDRQINDKLFGFGQLSYEKDEFSGFESRAFIGAGLGYEVLASDATQWTVRGGPGIKIDEIAATLTSPATTEESFGATATSNFAHKFNDNVSFTNDTNVLYAETSTQIGNIAALTATLTDTLSARISFEARHDTDPVAGFESTDTISRVSLVYGFGK
jgi:putative salt-induced outer membrane protein